MIDKKIKKVKICVPTNDHFLFIKLRFQKEKPKLHRTESYILGATLNL